MSVWSLRTAYRDPSLIINFFSIPGFQEPALQGTAGQEIRAGKSRPHQKLRKRTAIYGRPAKQTGKEP